MSAITHISGRTRDLGDFTVQRLLPAAARQKVGPWIFVDHFGPVTLQPGPMMAVRPHPHCALSTVTTLFEGAIQHRDSTGGQAIVRPGEIHWMRAGHGVVHSERTPAALRAAPLRAHGLQLWCAHPDGEEEQEPRFDSWTALPQLDVGGVAVQLLAGEGWGARSPVEATSTLIYAIARLKAGQRLALPDYEERCAYGVSGGFALNDEAAQPGELLVAERGAVTLTARTDAVVALLGGDPVGPRHLWWNLVHSDPDRLREQAERWRRGEFPLVPGDSDEFIPAPPGP